MHNNNSEKDLFSTGKNVGIIRVVSPVQSGSRKNGQKPSRDL